jgi:predicted Zn-dependent protease
LRRDADHSRIVLVQRSASRHLGLWIGCVALACANTNVDPIGQAAFAPEEDEAELWTEARQIDAKLQGGKFLVHDAELESYLNGVAARLLASSAKTMPPVQIHVLLDPYANAFALPNGSIYLHTGLIAPMENEAQLATVLGHEIVHFEGRHALRERRVEQNKEMRSQIAIGALAALGALGGNPYAAADLARSSTELAQQMIRTQMAGYSRDLESAADEGGVAMLLAAGYDPREAIAAFELLRADAEASEKKVPYAYASHPQIQERIDSVSQLVSAAAPAGVARADEFQQATAKVLLANAELELKVGAVTPARRALERYTALRPDDPAGTRALADAYRRSGAEPEHVQRAAAALERAAAKLPDDPAIQLELGLLYREQGDRARATSHLRRYLELSPEATDRPIILRYLAELQ